MSAVAFLCGGAVHLLRALERMQKIPGALGIRGGGEDGALVAACGAQAALGRIIESQHFLGNSVVP